MTGSTAAAVVNPPRSGTARSRGINYHGNLGRMLRDLTGFATLTFELLQNADDASATRLQIDVGQDALVVFNDAVFSDCGDQDLVSEDCPYLVERGHRCDFHSFRDVASGDKRDRADTTGAFGIGFTAVYQVADSAVLISNGRRWDIDEMRPESERILEEDAPDAQGTTFILPWACDPNSLFRRRTVSAAIGPDDPQQLFGVLVTAIPTAMLFLRHVREVELLRDGQTACRYRREDADEICEITGGDEPRQWLMLHGDFAEEAAALRAEFPGKIEERRRADVTVAVPLNADVDGLLCAYLPTDERSGLPAHVNADFYPESDRKHLITDSFHGRWNRLAVRAAARILAERLPDLAPLLGHEHLWRLIFAAYEVKPTGPNTGISAYWEEMGPLLPAARVMWTTTGQWTTPASTVFLYSRDEDEAIPVLERLGLLVIHPQVDAFVHRMSGRAGTRQLSVEILARGMLDNGLTGPTSLPDAPPAVATEESREILWRELERLLGRHTSTADRALLGRIALMPGTDGRLWPAELVKRADLDTARLVADLRLGVALLDQTALPVGCDRLARLCPSLDLPFVLTLLANRDGAQLLREALDSGLVTADRILAWLQGYEQSILASPDLKARVRALPIYPTGSGHLPLDGLMLPGGFTDRLGIAEAIDCEQVSAHVAFLQRLGATPLTLRTYLIESVPRGARRPGMLTDPRWQHLIVDLAALQDEFAQDDDVRQALTPLPLIPCGVGTFLHASSCYFGHETVTAVLGMHTPIARPLAGHERSTTSLYEWLGVVAEPRLPDVVERARQLAAGNQDPQARQSVAAVIGYLARFVPDRRTPAPDTLSPLREFAWLPTRGDHAWHRPPEVHTVFREQLFATQGRFLDIPLKVQQLAADFLHWLGLETNPTVAQVVAHLLNRAGQGTPVSSEVYVELNRNAADPAIDRLAGTACLLLPGGGYVAPATVFRQTNPFGRFRQLLGPEFDAIGHLLDRLGVKRIPDQQDARNVLIDIAREQQHRFHMPVEDDDLAVIWRCWQMLDEASARDEVDSEWFAPLRNLPVVPNAAAVLTPPTRLLIDDMPGVAAALNIGDALIRRKEGMWRAFQSAGVRSLTEAVAIEILEIQETTRDGAVRDRLVNRVPALARVLDGDPDGIRRLTNTLAQLSFPETPILQVRYHLNNFGVTSAETSLKALYVPEDPHENRKAQLISCPQDDNIWPWMLIAKEVARALYPGETPGPLASSLYVALNAPSLDAAHGALDDAGWPRMEHIEVALPDAGPGARFGGDDTSMNWPDHDQPDYTGDGAPESTAAPQPNAATPLAADWRNAEAAEDQATRGGSAAKSDSYDARDGAVGHSGGQPGQPHVGRTPSLTPQRPPAERTSRPSRRGRLRSYVVLDDSDGPNRTPVDRAPVDQAGVRRVVEVERAAGRRPEVMAHNNPGFDVVSRDDSGRILRHIEVKSTAGAWDDMGVGLSCTQFDFAQQHRETFWLYVVEYALDDDSAHVARIANPVGRAEEFRFDGGWSAVSEEADSDPPPPTGPRRSATTPGEGWIPLRTLRDDLTAETHGDEWVEWPGVAVPPRSYAVQVLGHALEPDIARGALVLVEPLARQPQDGELVVVQLRSGFDRDGRAAATVRRWVVQSDETHQAGSVALTAAKDNAIPPIYVHLSMIDVCGRVAAIRPNTCATVDRDQIGAARG